MIIKRQKLFVAPLLVGAGKVALGGLTAMGVAQGVQAHGDAKKQMKQTEEQMEQAESQSKAQVAALNKIAKAAEKNPQVANQTLQELQRSYAIPSVSPKFFKNATGFAKDMGKLAWGKKGELGKMAASGAAIAGFGYAADKYIQHDIKKNNLPLLPDNNANAQQRSYTAASSIFSKFAPQAKNILNSGKATINNAIKNPGEFGKKAWKNSKGLLTTGVIFGGAMPIMSYAAEKRQVKDQMAATTQEIPQQRSYTAASSIFSKFAPKARNIWQTSKNSVSGFLKQPGQKTLDGISWATGGGGKAGRESMVNAIKNQGAQSGNKWTQNFGNFLGNHGKTSAGLAIGGGLTMMSLGWGQGEKLTKKAIGAVDKNAYAYEKSKEQQIQ